MNKSAIQKFAIWARNELIGQIKQRAYQYGIDDSGYGDANAAVISGRVLSENEKSQRRDFVELIKRVGYEQAIEEVAYTWFNRFIALRYMEVNDYLPTHVRVFSDSNGAFNPEILKDVLHLELPGLDKAKVSELINSNATDDLYRYLLLTQCNALNEVLPEMFERMGGYSEILLPNNILRQGSVLERLVTDIPEADWRDAVQIIGWMYQYYNTEPKQAVFDGLKKNIKITKEKIPAATQLFTPHWIVRYMVENSLGRIFVNYQLSVLSFRNETERIAKEKEIAERMGWKYYLPEAEQTDEVRQKLIADNLQLTTEFNIEDIKFIDPCMGSGHILVYAFDVFMQIYENTGYSQRDAARLILEKNIHGLDIDKRAYQLAYFALFMKARQYNRRIFEIAIAPHAYHPTGCSEAEEYGSLLQIDNLATMPVPSDGQQTLTDDYETDLRVWNFKRLLSQKYDVVVTNPPYMGGRGMGSRLTEFVVRNYPDSKSDLFAAFIEKCGELMKLTGYKAMITQHAWMFLSSFEKLRRKVICRDIMNMAHLGARAFAEIGGEVVQSTTFVICGKHSEGYRGCYVRLINISDADEKERAFLSGNHRYSAPADNFAKIPGSPVAYWVSEKYFENFERGISIDELSDFTGSQNITSDNEKYVRFFWEVDNLTIGKTKHWAFYAKGGDYRKWYGNVVLVVDTSSKSMAYYKNASTANQLADKYWFTEGITYSAVTSKGTGFRYYPAIGGFDKGGATICYIKDLYYLLALLNTRIAQIVFTILNPTINLQIRDVKAFPVIINDMEIVEVKGLSENNVNLSQDDWDAFETSWDFKRHPLV